MSIEKQMNLNVTLKADRETIKEHAREDACLWIDAQHNKHHPVDLDLARMMVIANQAFFARIENATYHNEQYVGDRPTGCAIYEHSFLWYIVDHGSWLDDNQQGEHDSEAE